MNADDYLKLPYSFVLTPDENGGFSARVVEFPGCFSEGDTQEEAVNNILNAAHSWVEAMLNQGKEIPKPAEDLSRCEHQHIFVQPNGHGMCVQCGREALAKNPNVPDPPYSIGCHVVEGFGELPDLTDLVREHSEPKTQLKLPVDLLRIAGEFARRESVTVEQLLERWLVDHSKQEAQAWLDGYEKRRSDEGVPYIVGLCRACGSDIYSNEVYRELVDENKKVTDRFCAECDED